MGDRTFIYYKIHPADLAKTKALAPFRAFAPELTYEGDPSDKFPDDDGMREEQECNYGAGEDREQLAKAGVRFYGWHGEGCEYPCATFYATDGKLHEWDGDNQGGWSIHHNGTTGLLDSGQIERLQAFIHAHLACEKMISGAWARVSDQIKAALGPLTECQNCDVETWLSKVDPIDDIEQRIDAGEPMPAGQCPKCGALVHIKETP